MKARFLTRQPPVRWQELGNGRVDVTICVNETEAEEIIEDLEEGKIIQHYFEYDYNAFREEAKKMNADFVKANPEKFIKYKPSECFENEKIEKRIANLEQALIERRL